MNKNVFAIILMAAICVLSIRNAHAQEAVFDRVMKTHTINCGYFTWAPFTVKDSNTGKFTGINVEIMEAVGKNLGLKINWVAEVGVGDTVTALNTGKVDAICSSLWPSPERASNMTFSKPEFFDEFYAFARDGDKRFDGDLSKADNKNIKVTGIDNDVTASVADEKLPNATKIYLPQSASAAETLMYLMTSKADVVLIDQSTVDEFSKTNPGKIRMIETHGPVRVSGEHITLKRGEYQLRDMINIAIEQLTDDGTIGKITDRYSKEYKSKFMAPQKSYIAR